MADRTQKALAEFVSEAQETIDALGRDVMRLESAGAEPDPDLVNAVFRAAHTLKGLSSMSGVERMARLAHALEDVLDDVRMGRRPLDRETADLLLEAPEVLSRIIAEESLGEPPRTAHAAARLSDDDLVPRCRIDGWVDEGEVTERAAEDLARLGPFGAGHPEPVFALRGAAARARAVGAGGAHLKLALGGLDAIGFGLGERLPACAGRVEAAFSVGFDEWDGTRRLQLKLRDLRRAG